MLSNSLLDEWCENIKKEGIKIESAYGFDDTIYINFAPEKELIGLFLDKNRTRRFFRNEMPRKLKQECKEQNFKMTFGATRFVLGETKEEKIIGYSICLRRI